MDKNGNLINIKDAEDRMSLGNKAVSLGELKRAGFNVPEGFVLSSTLTEAILSENGIKEEVAKALQKLDSSNIHQTAEEITLLTQALTLPDHLEAVILSQLNDQKLYAIRSSGTLEDLNEASFAGQYESFLNVSYQEVPRHIVNCIRSLWKEPILSYLVHQEQDPAKASMAVIIQEMVAADLAGVMFSINPTTGDDKQMVIEVIAGLGDSLVSGQADPESYLYNWYEAQVRMPKNASLLSKKALETLAVTLLNIQKLYGHPVDVEFAVKEGRNYFLQTRPVTRINYSGLKDQWSTADFKDGGVSATVSKPLMLSLYEYIWETELKRFLLESHILTEKELRKLSIVRFGRMYWNVSVVKAALAKVPGYKERKFDEELGIESTVEGGSATPWSPLTGARLLRMALAQNKIRKERSLNREPLKRELLAVYEQSLNALHKLEGQELKNAWIDLVHNLYLKSEGTYFWQIFLNNIHMGLARDAILKHTDQSTYYDLIGGITNISHLRPFYDLWDLSRIVRVHEKALTWWLEEPVENLVLAIQDVRQNQYFLSDFRKILNNYEYHSERELDVSWPDFSENPSPLIVSFRDTLTLDEAFSPESGKRKLHSNYLKALEDIQLSQGRKVANKLQGKAEQIRSMLWWREEFRDISTRYYHLIRLFTLKLAQLLNKEDILLHKDNIWFLSKDNLVDLLHSQLSPENAAEIIKRNHDYYESFRNFQNDNEIGQGFAPLQRQAHGQLIVSGLPGSGGRITGRARVIPGLEEINQLEPGDILITRFTDTGWTSKFAMLSGVVTEFGGALCHAAIVSREYGIPCIVGAKGAMELIRDGEIITIDGATGTIQKEDI